MKFYILILSIFLTLFGISGSSLSVSYGDLLGIGILVYFLNDLLKERVYTNRYVKYSFLYVLLMFVSSVINVTFLEGPFLNIFRTSLFGLVYFCVVLTMTINGQLNGEKFFAGITLLALLFLFKTWPQMQAAWSTQEFTNVNIFDSSLNLNTWGFTLVLFLAAYLFCWLKGTKGTISLFLVLTCLYFVFFSFSRTAYGLSFLSLFISAFFLQKRHLPLASKKNIIVVFIMMLIITIAVNMIEVKLPDNAWEFFTYKSNNAADDLVNTRFYMINIEPLDKFYSNFNVIHFLLGDGISHQHSFLSHTLIVTGIFGFLLFVRRYLFLIRRALLAIRGKSYVVEFSFILLLISLILINDFITNISFYLPISSYLGNIILAHIYGLTHLHTIKNEEKAYNSHRI